MKVLFLEVTLEQQNQNGLEERVNTRFTPTKILEQLRTLQIQLEAQSGCQQARLLQNTQDPNVLLLESTWRLEMPEVIEGFPIEGLKCRRWAFDSI